MAGLCTGHTSTITLTCLSVLLIGPCGYGDTTSGGEPRALSISDAITIAYANNKQIQIQEKEIRAARANILGAVSNFLPKLNVNGSYTYNDAVMGIPSDFLQSSKKDLGVFTGYKNDHMLAFSATESAFNGGADIANVKKSQVNLKIQEETLRARNLDVGFEAKRLYYGLLLAYDTERIAQNLVDQADAHYQDVKNKFDQGATSRFDLLQSAVSVSLHIPELVKAQKSIELVMAELNKLLSIPVYNPVRLRGHLVYSPISIREGEFLKEAYVNRPEMILKSLGVDMQKWSIEMARAGRLPQVTADLDLYYRGDRVGDMFNSRHDNWFTGVTVSIPVFDGFSTKAKVDEAKARYAQAGIEKENVADQTTVDIRRACLDLKQAEAIIVSQRDSVTQAGEALRISETRYDNGVGTNLDVLDSMVSLSQVEKNLASGIYDYIMAKAYLYKSMGKSVITEE
ncbi:MAG: TolC family protein [Candidatus Aureabacteria bacterium]|nr:TolC family protein [Candidatus Auribacterota bacterium]